MVSLHQILKLTSGGDKAVRIPGFTIHSDGSNIIFTTTVISINGQSYSMQLANKPPKKHLT